MRFRDDRGVGTLLGMVLALALLGAGLTVVAIVSITVTRQRATVAADLAALAAVTQGCEAAVRVAQAQGAASVTCRDEGGDAVVSVGMPAPPILTRFAEWTGNEVPVMSSASRAGPGAYSGG
jgi:secretion/DNA translocation related TadE-like protein